MYLSTLVGLAASVAYVQAVYQGFNYGATKADGETPREESDYQALFSRAQDLQGTSGFTSARLYTMIQGGTTDTMSSAFQAAINTKTSLLLGLWCSAGQTVVTNEINAFTSAVQQYGSDFTSLIQGISVGSEDLYRVSPTGIENDSGAGATPDELVSYIKQVRSAISGTSASGVSIGHVDTWTAWVNGSNSAVIEAVDWLGMDTYPYFETTVTNSIANSNSTFWDAYDKTLGVSSGKEVWITETGWPISGKTENLAVPSVQNAETYWQEVACELLGNYNTWWYTIEDADSTGTPSPSFGIIGADLDSAPMYDLTCKKQNTTSPKKGGGNKTQSASQGSSTGNKPAHTKGSGGGNGNHTSSGAAKPTKSRASANSIVTGGHFSKTKAAGSSATASGSAAASASKAAATGSGTSDGTRAGSAASAALLAIFGLVAAF